MKFGITERGDASIDYGWVGKIAHMDGAILITKHITERFIFTVMREDIKNKVIVHATCTGFGGTVIEPNVPTPDQQLDSAAALVAAGFPAERIVIRVDPVIPTESGIRTAEAVLNAAYERGFRRFRISVIDMYRHARERFVKAHVPLPYGNNISASEDQFRAVNNMIWRFKKMDPDIRIECCAEPLLTEALYSGCVGEYDIALLGLNMTEEDWDKPFFQRKGCLCIPGKTELLTKAEQCSHQCLYCYWQN